MLFLQGLDLHGKEWKKISKMVKSRSLVQIRSHAQKYFQKLSATADEDDDASAASGGRVLLMNGKRGGARFEKTATTTALVSAHELVGKRVLYRLRCCWMVTRTLQYAEQRFLRPFAAAQEKERQQQGAWRLRAGLVVRARPFFIQGIRQQQ
jgi:SHAQKYF class myb-like DNA-binding protein